MKLDLSQLTVLVVDDDESFRQALARMLTVLGYSPLHAGSAEQAAGILESQQVDLMLLDLQLPGVHGHALMREMNRQQVAVPVVVMSGVGGMDDVVQAMRQHAVDFLKKPFAAEELSAALDRAKQRRDDPEQEQPGAIAEPAPEQPAASSSARPQAWTQAPGPGAASPGRQPSRATPAATRPGKQPADGIRPAVRRMVEQLRGGTIKLPVLDPRLAEIQGLINRPTTGTDQVVAAVGGDVSLVTAVIRMANSGYYRLQAPVKTLREACVRLGNKRVFSIAVELLVKQQFSAGCEPYTTVLAGIWRNVFVAARICGRLAAQLGRRDAEELYLATLLHNVGEMLVVQLLAEMEPQVNASLEEVAQEVQRTHELLGQALARSWGMPQTVIRLAGYHHRPQRSPEPADQEQERHLVLAAWSMAVKGGYPYLPGHERCDPAEALQVLGLTEGDVEDIYRQAKEWVTQARV